VKKQKKLSPSSSSSILLESSHQDQETTRRLTIDNSPKLARHNTNTNTPLRILSPPQEFQLERESIEWVPTLCMKLRALSPRRSICCQNRVNGEALWSRIRMTPFLSIWSRFEMERRRRVGKIDFFSWKQKQCLFIRSVKIRIKKLSIVSGIFLSWKFKPIRAPILISFLI
jgi:hypothetical protein